MTWYRRCKRGLAIWGWVAVGCGPSSDDPSGGSMSTGGGDTTVETGQSSTASLDSGSDSGSGAVSSASTTGSSLPCAWEQSTFEADIPGGMTPSNLECDPDTSIATLQLTFADSLDCGDSVTSDYLIIEIPPKLQVAGEYDLVGLARIQVSADLEPVSGAVDAGTLIITEVTATTITGWARGGLDGYDFVGSFVTGYCD